MERPPEHEHGGGGDRVGHGVVLQRGLCDAAGVSSLASVTDEPDSDERDGAEDDPDPGALPAMVFLVSDAVIFWRTPAMLDRASWIASVIAVATRTSRR